jgi:hypothetical protein
MNSKEFKLKIKDFETPDILLPETKISCIPIERRVCREVASYFGASFSGPHDGDSTRTAWWIQAHGPETRHPTHSYMLQSSLE